MATLLKNVFAAEQWWGPDYGNADAVPAVVAAAMDLHLFGEPPRLDDDSAEPTPPPHEPSQSPEPTGESLMKPQPVDGFGWLANPDAQAAVELLEESAVPHIDDTAAADPAPEALALSGNGDTP